ncbi:hypothetical protein SAMN05445756_0112 [Kytococcus aerolatus]|uniref:Acetone carboxylase n=1 Tax=Kytococcus aerolatus TaxID=592308 RepID=A0A212T0X1_9MICO|nr:hypothetical protein [Kytococcus aerolatus]SNC59659.1 hypothetical protein SAMN05445756_0112 [Kytococcus aerolatus]
MLGDSPTPGRPTRHLVCSATGCRATPPHALVWNNPRVHAPERRKVWLACDEHRERLTSFLDLRGFLREAIPCDDLTEEDG